MANQATRQQRRLWADIATLGCIVIQGGDRCCGIAEIHHCGTGAGGRKDHSYVIPLCYHHHRGIVGIHSMSRKEWQEMYGTEQELFEKTMRMIQ